MARRSSWTEEEEAILISESGTLTASEIAKMIGKTRQAVLDKRKRMGLRLSDEQLSELRARGAQIAAERNGGYRGEKNPNWKGGISENHYHYKQLQKKRYPERVRARELVKREINAGRLKREPCEKKCGAPASESVAHHDDYSKPLDVRWLCPKCHREHHESLKRKGRGKNVSKV